MKTQKPLFRRLQKSSPIVEELITAFRQTVSFTNHDRVLQPDMQAATDFVTSWKI